MSACTLILKVVALRGKGVSCVNRSPGEGGWTEPPLLATPAMIPGQAGGSSCSVQQGIGQILAAQLLCYARICQGPWGRR